MFVLRNGEDLQFYGSDHLKFGKSMELLGLI